MAAKALLALAPDATLRCRYLAEQIVTRDAGSQSANTDRYGNPQVAQGVRKRRVWETTFTVPLTTKAPEDGTLNDLRSLWEQDEAVWFEPPDGVGGPLLAYLMDDYEEQDEGPIVAGPRAYFLVIVRLEEA